MFNCFGSTAASGTAASGTTSAGGGILQWLPLVVIFVVFIALIIIPQKRRDKKAKEMLSSIKVGDRIKTIGGFYGKVLSVKDDLIVFECGPDKVKMQIAKGAVSAVDSSDVENGSIEKEIQIKPDKSAAKDTPAVKSPSDKAKK